MVTLSIPEARPIYEQKYITKGHSSWVRSIAFSPDGRHLASASDDMTIKLWEVKSGALINTLRGHSSWVVSLQFHPNGQHLATASIDNTIHLWDHLSGARITTLVGHSKRIWSIGFSPDGTLLASASSDGTVRLWDTESEAQIATLNAGNHKISCVVFTPDGRYLASGVNNSIDIWEVASRTKVNTLRGHTGVVTSVTFSPDGALLSSGSNDKTVRLWNAASGEAVATIEGHSDQVKSVAFSPNGAVLASGSRDRTIILWTVSSTSRLSTLSDDLSRVLSVTFSFDGSHLASGLEDGTVRLWQRSQQDIINNPALDSLAAVVAATHPDAQDADSPSSRYAPAALAGRDISNSVTLTDSNRIGSGGFGDLFLGVHKDFGKVAMKRPHVPLNEVSLRRFLREIDLWCDMSHRYILPCLGTCRIGRDVYMVSPFVENGDLMACIQHGMDLDRSKLLYEVAEALAHLHHRGIVHGDVKAQNVLLSNDNTPLLCDFGLAKAFDTMATSTEAKGFGSVRWMGPELLTGETGRSMASDVYSFGITIAEVLSGRMPFEHLSENTAVLFHVLLKNGRPVKEPLNSTSGKSYSVLWEVAEKCWAADPEGRPVMAEVLGMLFPLTREK